MHRAVFGFREDLTTLSRQTPNSDLCKPSASALHVQDSATIAAFLLLLEVSFRFSVGLRMSLKCLIPQPLPPKCTSPWSVTQGTLSTSRVLLLVFVFSLVFKDRVLLCSQAGSELRILLPSCPMCYDCGHGLPTTPVLDSSNKISHIQKRQSKYSKQDTHKLTELNITNTMDQVVPICNTNILKAKAGQL